MSYNFALVTGATSGIGAAFARALSRRTHLLLTGRDEAKLEEMSAGLSAPGRRVETVAADLTEDDGRRALIEKAEACEIDLLINNAGAGKLGPFLTNPAEREKAIVELNVVAPVVLTRALLPGMVERARASRQRAGLINVSSNLALMPVPYLATYAASKAFDLWFSEALAEELRGEPVDVLALCPGATATNFGKRAGFSLVYLPGASRPETVAREGLAALGRQTVHMVGITNRLAFAPVLLPRGAIRSGLGRVMGLIQNQFGG